MDQKSQQPVYQSGPQPTPQPFMHPEPVYQPGQPPSGQYPPGQFASELPANGNGRSDWKADLFDCSPFDTCLLSTCLPCVLAGRTVERIRDPSLQSEDCCNSDCMCFCAIQTCTGCGWLYVMMKRSEIRERFGIDGGGCDDCCIAYWCPCCALIQQDNEVVARLTPAVPVQGYKAPSPMEMPNAQQ